MSPIVTDRFGLTLAYTYDANGNQLTRTVGGTGGITTAFTFDVRDELSTVRQGSSLLGSYSYDSRGLRVVKQGSLGYVHYTYDDHSVLYETDVLGAPLAKFDYGSDRLLSLTPGSGGRLYETDVLGAPLAKFDYGSDRLLSLTPGSGGRQFYLFDALGSVTDLTNLDGSLRATYQYDAWGNPRSTSGQSFNLFGFTGHERDPETGLYYFKHRFYDPATGRFLTEDPVEGKADNPPSLQRYLYAYGNPTIYIDPDGRWPSLNDLIDVGTAAVESLVKTQRQVDKAVAKGIVNTAVNVLDFASLGSISTEKKRFDTFRNTKGSLIDKANAASQVSTVKERLNVVSLGFSGAPDKVQHLKDITGVGSVQRAGQLYEDAYVDQDFSKALQGTGELSQGFVQMVSLAEGGISVAKFLRGGAARAVGAQAVRESVSTLTEEGGAANGAQVVPAPPRQILEARITGESAAGGVEAGDTIIRKSVRASTDTPGGGDLFKQLPPEGRAGDSIGARIQPSGDPVPAEERPTTSVLSDVTVQSFGKVIGRGNVYLRATIEALSRAG